MRVLIFSLAFFRSHIANTLYGVCVCVYGVAPSDVAQITFLAATCDSERAREQRAGSALL